MSFCVPDWEGHGFSESFPSSNSKSKPSSSIEAPFMPDDVFEELYWEDGKLISTSKPFEKQLSSWEANAPVQATRDHGNAPLYVGRYATSLDGNVDAISEDTSACNRVGRSSSNIFDDDLIAWLQYPLDTELHVDDMYSKHPVISYLPSLPLENSDGLACRAYALTGAVDGERHSIRNHDNGSKLRSLTCTQASICTGSHTRSFGIPLQSPDLASTADASHDSEPNAQSFQELVSPETASISPPQFVYSDTPKSLQPICRLAAYRKPVAGVSSFQAVVDRGECIQRQNSEACASANSAFESAVTGAPSVLVDSHITNPSNAVSMTVHQVHDAVPIKAPDAITRIDISGTLRSTAGTCCTDGADIKTFSKDSKIDECGDYRKRKVKDSDDSESQTEDLVKQPEAISKKRSRAAEMHNKSERKRRERINEKLKALEELIPNANKTDKASLLGEAIEYLKALQAQIMVLSYRTGVTIPPMLLSHGMLQSYAPQHVGMGYGPGIVMNSNAVDVGVPVSASSLMRQIPSQMALLPTLILPSPAGIVGAGNTQLVEYSANYLPMANMGAKSYLIPQHQLQTPPMEAHHKSPFFL